MAEKVNMVGGVLLHIEEVSLSADKQKVVADDILTYVYRLHVNVDTLLFGPLN